MNGYLDQKPPRKGGCQPETIIFSGIMLFLFGVLIWLYGALQNQIYEGLYPGLSVDYFPPIGILIFGVVLIIIGIILREGNA